MNRYIFKPLLYFLIFAGISCCLGACGSSEVKTSAGSVEEKDSEAETDENDSQNKERKSVFGDWMIQNYVDEFGDSTGNTYCQSICSGTFENSATTGSDLMVITSYDLSHELFLFQLFEYNDNKATYLSSSDMSIKCKIGEAIFEDTLIGTPPDGFVAPATNNKKLFNYLNNGQDIRVVINIDNSKYNFTISGDGFQLAISEQKKRQQLAGISGTYKNVNLKGDAADWFVIKQETPETGTITNASSSGSATLDYTYDPTTCILTVKPDDAWTYRCLYDQFIVNDVVMFPYYGNFEGEIPDGSTFDAKITWLSPENKATNIYEFKKDGSFVKSGTNYKGEKTKTKTGTYIVQESFLFETLDSGTTFVDYIYEGKLYTYAPGIYVIDK